MKKRILLVEDNLATQSQLIEILQALGYSPATANDGLGGLNLALNKRFDLIITDHKMPLMDGLVLARNLREDSFYKNVPIVLLTTDDYSLVAARAEKLNINTVLAKPLNKGDLAAALNDYAEQDIA
ncbi:MAG: chemotaxis signal relay system CheY family response regulator [Idiomarinaceae bacterium HL-53]|nr:MAG: chemotaxis signal relay system CheY family response regulator [Idiomarinaceae bacterium HL-53]CUS49454.1 two-component system, chemotaxis family, response regulator CheY [Idiomarinaceae bacterium HL-53]